MKQYQTGLPMTLPLINLLRSAAAVGAATAAVSTDTEYPSFSITDSPLLPGEFFYDTVIKPTVIGAYNLYRQVPGQAANAYRRFLNTATPREAIVDPMIQYHLGAGSIPVGSWKHVRDGFVRANPRDFSIEYHLDPVTVVGRRTIPISDPTASWRTVTINPELFKRRILRTAEEPESTANSISRIQAEPVPVPTPDPQQPDPDNKKKSWWRRIFNRNSTNNTGNSEGWFDQTFRLSQPVNWTNFGYQAIGRTLQSIPTLGTIIVGSELLTTPLKNSGRIERTPWEWLLDQYLPVQTKTDEQSAPQSTNSPADKFDLQEYLRNQETNIQVADSLDQKRQGGR